MKTSIEAQQKPTLSTQEITATEERFAGMSKFDQVSDLFMATVGVGGMISPEELMGVIQSADSCLSTKIVAVQALVSNPDLMSTIHDDDIEEFFEKISLSGDARTGYEARKKKPSAVLAAHKNRFREEPLLEKIMAFDGLSESEIRTLINWDDFSFHHSFDSTYGEIFGNNYADEAIELLRYIYKHSQDNGAHLPNELKILIPASIELHDNIFTIIKNDETVSNSEALAFLTGSDFKDALKDLEDDTELAARYQKCIETSLGLLPDFVKGFPEEFRAAVQLAVIDQISNIAFALRDIAAGKSDKGYIDLGKNKLPINTDRTSAFSVMAAIEDTLATVAALSVRGQKYVKSTNSEGFVIFRYLDTEGRSSAYKYIRPTAGETFDEAYEYGRSGDGVEASIGFVIALDESTVPIGKAAAALPGTISVRIDREGIDPYKKRDALSSSRSVVRQIGTLSCDFGSVLGRDDNIGVKVARFLSFAETARGATTPEDRKLNHSPYYFPVGDSDYFESILLRELKTMEYGSGLITKIST